MCKNVDNVQLDLATPGDLLETKARVEALGRLDIILANAGIGNGGQTVETLDEDVWQTMMDINLTGVWKT